MRGLGRGLGKRDSGGAGAPWYSLGKADGVDPSLWIDFKNKRYAVNSSEKTFSEILTFTRSSTGTYFDDSGVLRVAAVNEPRFDCDPITKVCKGLLFEEQRTNTFFQNNLDTLSGMSGWTGITNADTTINAALAPDGTNTAVKFTDGVGTGSKRTYKVGGSYTAGTIYTFSIFAKAAEHSKFSLSGESGTFGVFNAIFNLSGSGSFISTGATYASIQSVGNGWYRCSITKAATGTYGDGLAIGLTNNTDTFLPSYTGTNSGVYIWGVQDEVGSYPSSYIPTTTASITRAADSCLNNASNAVMPSVWRGASAESALVRASQMRTTMASRMIDPQGSGGVGMLWTRDSANIGLSWTNVGGDQGDLIIPHGGVFGGVETYAAAVATGDMAGCYNGGAISTDATVTFGVRDLLYIGNRADLARAFNGHIQEVRIYPLRVSNTELQRISA